MDEAPDLGDAGAVCTLFGRAAEALRGGGGRRGASVMLPSRGRLLATGDLHDRPFHLRRIVRFAHLEASPDHHLVLHELIHGGKLLNGMDFSYRMLARVAHLAVRYPDQVHPLLANHELAQMTGTGLSKGAGNSVELFRDGLAFVFGPRCEAVAAAIGTFIRAMPLAARSAGGVLCAHSLPGPAMMKHFDPAVLERDLVEEDYHGPAGAAYALTWGRGPRERDVEMLAGRWGVRLFCLGHEHVETGVEIRGRRVVLLNSDHARAAVLPLDLAAVPEAGEALLHAVPLAALAS